MKISYVFTCGRLESLFKILNLIQSNENKEKNDKVIEQFRKDISLGRTFEETELYQLIEDSEEKIVVNRLNNILRDKPAHQNKFDFQEYKKSFTYVFDNYTLSLSSVKCISIASNDKYGNTEIVNLNFV